MFTKFLSIFQRRLIVTYCRRTNYNNNNNSDNINSLLKFHKNNDNNLINFNIRKNSSNSTNNNNNINNKNFKHQNDANNNKKNIRSTLYYVTAAGVLFIGCTYAAVPLYRMFCQAYSYGGTVKHGGDNVENMKKIEDRILRIKFNADVSSSMRWNFRPQQREIRVIPGETALAFYTAKNPTDQPVIGISTYNVIPFEAGQYFNKIQCFCFEEQQLNPHEEVDMPVFFYIDPEFVDDPKMEFIDEIILSYTFFESKEGMKLPIPSYITRTH